MSNQVWGMPIWVWLMVAAVGIGTGLVAIVRSRARGARDRRGVARGDSSVGDRVTPPQFRIFRPRWGNGTRRSARGDDPADEGSEGSDAGRDRL
jgi:hypothetical protein